MNDDKRAQPLLDANRLTMAYERAHQAFSRAIGAQRLAKAAIIVASGALLLTLAEAGYILWVR